MKIKKQVSRFVYLVGLLAGFYLFPTNVFAQCEVLLDDIKGTYDGGCKKGKAYGFGKAVGTDTYEGEFKKGLPHGKGTYTWANGNVFTGMFKKGKKEGEGKLIFHIATKDSTCIGYWLDDEYIGKEPYPYKLTQKDFNIVRASFKRISSSGNEIQIFFVKGGKVISTNNISIIKTEGRFTTVHQSPQTKTILDVTFPFSCILRGGAAGFEFRITQRGIWKITVEIKP
ncbi:MAG: MORN repeat-containing protein [Bacteroidales bacterium]|nr:MORN repeat-containing protein [Bacteroidales bacterium]